ncbi:hypothetical protein V6N12_031001 [Hibiscus sabdariffa]|uniref:Uncharacterized protein n=1 Tax=Hibiscus sabdariffa TaxID=183260 RepID=A0ABR2E7Q0_9ROSI
MQGSYFASFSPAKRGYNIVRQGTRTRVRGGVIQLIVGGERDVEFFDLKGAKKICARPLNQDDRVDNFSEEHLLHRVLKHSVWLEDATYRIRQLYLSYYWSISKSLVHSMAHKLILAMMNGDFSEEEDTDNKGCVYIIGPASNQWGFTVEGKDLWDSVVDIAVTDKTQLYSNEGNDVRKDLQKKLCSPPLLYGRTIWLLAVVISSNTIRDSFELTYDISFELSLVERLKFGLLGHLQAPSVL